VTERATVCLAAAGYDDVTVVCADAERRVEPGRCYDVIVVTAARALPRDGAGASPVWLPGRSAAAAHVG
jgi:protein-L-isoaspartate O-methyltransferase